MARRGHSSIGVCAFGLSNMPKCSMPWKRPFLWHNPFNRLHLQVKWHATNQQSMGGGHNRRKLAGDGAKRPPRREVSSALFGTHRYQIANRVGCLPGLRSAAPLQKLIGCMQGPCETGETGETLDNPSMVSVPLCTKLEMSDINRGN